MTPCCTLQGYILPCSCRGDLSACPLRGHRAGGLRPEPAAQSQPKALVTWRGALSKARDFLFEIPTDALGRVNVWISRIAIVALVAIWAVYLETFL